ncbi:hypothetical protein L3X38_038401 [Prunus dulcis]|uniref:Uncharacterized protein n=1 Tax=Prunus dulcis TaxID=3755 RepID=A0AAD4V5J5_PRUDU|nr:hypothetical protein L3X38_038401 [Prunus dulcis]
MFIEVLVVGCLDNYAHFDRWFDSNSKAEFDSGPVIKGPSSPHNTCVRCADDLMKSSQHIEKVIHKEPKEQILEESVMAKGNN